ncbi:hypothetical protein BC629DRAFT_1501194 [Irpex lacteus]|nr:hypothetical protein BC629DRAFT_1501194 [Irpex lacteus]
MSKKAAKNQPKEQTYEIRDIVLAKVRGFPPWPGMVVDPDTVPPTVAKERPNAKTKGHWYCVRFFPAGDYAWSVPKDMSRLQQHEIQAYIDEPFKRSGELLAGYKIALNPKQWEEDRELLQAQAAEAEALAEVDQLQDTDGEAELDEDKPKPKKRKRDSEAAPAKSKAKAKTKKEPAEPKKKAAATTKGKKNGVKSKATVESEDEGGAEDEDAGPSKKASPPPAKKQKKGDKEEEDVDAALANDPEATKVRDWRHKLQKAFLGKAVPKDEDMPALDQLFTTVEDYDNMTIQYLTFSKIGKVMRHINALPEAKVPRDSEFSFRERAKSLVDKWHEIISASKTDGTVRKPVTNGKHTEDSGAKTESKKEESPAEEAAEEKSNGDAMDIDKSATADAEAEAEADAPAEEDAPADAAAEEPADVAMSEKSAAA